MSRSYKKAVFKSSACKKTSKRLASKAVRNLRGIDNGGAYRQAYPSYDINDYAFDERFDRYVDVKGARKTGAGWMIPK